MEKSRSFLNVDLNAWVSLCSLMWNASEWLSPCSDSLDFAWRMVKSASNKTLGHAKSLLDGVLLAVKLRLAPLVCKLFFRGLLKNILHTLQAYLQQMCCTDHSNIQDTWSGALNLINISLVIFYSLGHKAHYPQHLSATPQSAGCETCEATCIWLWTGGHNWSFQNKGCVSMLLKFSQPRKVAIH